MRFSRLSAVRTPAAAAVLALAAAACGAEGKPERSQAADSRTAESQPTGSGPTGVTGSPTPSPTPTPTPSATPTPTPTPAPPVERVTGAVAKSVAPQISPGNGETVGVGQPLAVVFKGQKVDQALRAGIEGQLKVTTSPQVNGAWHWAEAKGDTVVHYRPKTYWPKGTKVTLEAGLAKAKLTAGTAVDRNRSLSFTVGESMVSTVDLKAHTMTVVRNGETLRAIPISGGEDRFKTREGIKTVLAKEGRVIMDSRTIGIPRDSPDGYYGSYDWSMRETISGEYVHAAPDNAEAFGKENVSHGCIGMSEADAKWLYGLSSKGDVIQVTGSGRPMDHFGNGYGDWNLSWDQWLQGSATGERNG
ncbi:hypothetical protein CFP65_2261 [Kitasatospora sp. MMS16-BH015]|uniref:L,D-transpeptidase n=1 Tax=Kitasatospora sp. MMS16-BH015 TaxID=2018025 RepID=UPI000CA15105|nr:L,D-transpeptidase [Kitasatospora sp. MMS16-BH015]AUG77101.1 hypothetical protein CFP65_2261 [Kitasatospora sp. MMS16-BH015]